jgi:hypothetical protein
VPTEVHLDGRGEPAKRPGVAHATNEGGLRNAEFEGDLLEFVVLHGTLKEYDDRGIAALRSPDERVDPPESVTEADVDRFHL